MARKELTKSKALEYARAPKKRKGEILDNLCEDTSWSRDNARRQLKRALALKKCDKKQRASRPLKFSARARQILTNVWILAGTVCGQYLQVMIAEGLIERLVTSGELKEGPRNTGRGVGADDAALSELRQMSSATIDRYLKEERKRLEPLSRSTTKKSTYALKGEIPFGKSYALVTSPGWLSIDTVAHCGNSLKGEHLWTLNTTDVLMGWTETVTVKNRARKWIVAGHDEVLKSFPFPIKGANYDGGPEFINYEMFDYAKMHHYLMTRSRPYHSNDNAHVEQRNGDVVRRYSFRYRYEGQKALVLLNELWHWVNLRKNYLVPCKKCIGHTKTRSGRTRGIYDKPKTPYRRVLDSGVLTKKKAAELEKVFRGLNDAHVTRMINEIQQRLLGLLTDRDMVEFVNEQVEAALAA